MELDDAYANASHIKGAEGYPPRWQAKAKAFRDGLGGRAELGLPYGDSPRQAFDVFRPQNAAKGTVVFIHGGFWRAFDGSAWSHLAAGPLARGWAVAMPSYDLCPQVSIADITRQIAVAVRSVAARTEGPIAITGHSAGGHLGARMLDRCLIPDAVGQRISAVVPVSPLSDLRPLLKTTMNEDFKLTEQAAIDESPLFMTDRRKVPVTVWVGADERPAFLDQARWLAEKWHADHVIAPGKHHFDVIDAMEDAQSDLVCRLTA
ncbi:alpha/beta hydrolase [Sedimentitalea nanhaiensis]|uniref:Acetyl esterase/lipase n=1 Tax=Sedimentitalea nanhaiensis TaxID=999627 RepID=A0A1I7DTH6_9RHOB|nr:alpha/beta hydrolase [Sedimentitalea nanhaiensis]SFU14949.1 Acetyl esterase/lipase [Sedimentitalea nanhaiensis]